MIKKIIGFITEVGVELRKVSWPTKQEVKNSTVLVIISSAFLGLYIATTDLILSRLIALIF